MKFYRVKPKFKKNKLEIWESSLTKNRRENTQKEEFGFKKSMFAVSKTVKISILRRWHWILISKGNTNTLSFQFNETPLIFNIFSFYFHLNILLCRFFNGYKFLIKLKKNTPKKPSIMIDSMPSHTKNVIKLKSES